ncbi:hypothetical protein [Bacillus altitudinis]|uniref:hypothetical protein n=1 Tax=Bacillus altitudinis TaxID=293387 RepID=UPI0012CF8888|nr:hypothetical protein [Bacillus altitudinis]VWA43618.1 hypothetical protein [Bacillus altitudinis]
MNDKITLIGEENYIYWDSIKNLSKEQLKERLSKVQDIKEENKLYKYFIKTLMYGYLDDKQKFLEELERFQLTLENENGELEMFTIPTNITRVFTEIKGDYDVG